jgi:hypothetical protein
VLPTPTVVTGVPTTLPANGVDVQHIVTLMSLPATFTPTLTREQAIVAECKYADAQPYPATALLAGLTVPASVPPPGDQTPACVVQNVPVWVVTFTAPHSTPICVGRPVPNGSPPPNCLPVSRFKVAIDPHTGAFVFGCFTA